MKYITYALLLIIFPTTSFASENTSTIKELLDAKRAAFNAKADDRIKSDFELGVEAVRESGVIESALKAGDKAPHITLPNALREDISLYDLLEESSVILVWYRGGWCPYCNIYLRHLQQRMAEFKEAGVQLVAISPELPDNSLTTQEKNDLAFHVLSDKGNKAGKAFGIVYKLPEVIAEHYKALNLASVNGDDSNELPLSATYVIAQDGTISHAFLDADYRKRAEPAAILEAVKGLK